MSASKSHESTVHGDASSQSAFDTQFGAIVIVVDAKIGIDVVGIGGIDVVDDVVVDVVGGRVGDVVVVVVVVGAGVVVVVVGGNVVEMTGIGANAARACAYRCGLE